MTVVSSLPSSSTASSMLVNVAEDAELRLISLLVDTAPTGVESMQSFQEQCHSYISSGNATGLLQCVIESNPCAIQSLFVLDHTNEATAAFSILAALLQRVQNSNNINQSTTNDNNVVNPTTADMSMALANLVVNATTTMIDRKVTLLSVLYNMRTQPTEKCWLLEQMYHVAGSGTSTIGSSTDMLKPESVLGKLISVPSLASDGTTTTTTTATSSGSTTSRTSTFNNDRQVAFKMNPSQDVPPIVTLLDTWNIPVKERRSLYRTIVSVLSSSSSTSTMTSNNDVRKQQFLLLLIDTYDNNDNTDEDDNKKAMIQCAIDVAIGAIYNPISLFYQQRNLLNKYAIQQLCTIDPLLYGLLQIVQEKKVVDYEEYINNNGGIDKVLKPYGLDNTLCQKHMRILSLCSLASEHEEIPYSVIATTLRLENEDTSTTTTTSTVETWVIATVNSGLLQAKMDQLKEQVMVEKCMLRQFDIEQWKMIQMKLNSFKSNISTILSSLKQQNQLQQLAVASAAK